MGMFVEIVIDQGQFPTREARERLARLCPVDALKAGGDRVSIDPENEDECTFCELCVQQSPAGAVRVVKTYADWLARG